VHVPLIRGGAGVPGAHILVTPQLLLHLTNGRLVDVAAAAGGQEEAREGGTAAADDDNVAHFVSSGGAVGPRAEQVRGNYGGQLGVVC
jgi:hypothetical protein